LSGGKSHSARSSARISGFPLPEKWKSQTGQERAFCGDCEPQTGQVMGLEWGFGGHAKVKKGQIVNYGAFMFKFGIADSSAVCALISCRLPVASCRLSANSPKPASLPAGERGRRILDRKRKDENRSGGRSGDRRPYIILGDVYNGGLWLLVIGR
jgi:hypothetical protein